MGKLLLTGATGFIGRYILKELNKKKFRDEINIDTIKLFVRSPKKATDLTSQYYNYEIVEGDLLDHESIKGAVEDITYLIHTAALYDTSSKREMFEKVNIEATRVFMENIDNNSDVVLTSTYGIYGFPNLEDQITEDFEERQPYWHYQETKEEQENLAFKIAEERGVNLIAIRPPTVIGPGDYFFIPNFIESLKNNQVFYLRKNGENIIPFAHPEDIANAHLLALENIDKFKGEAYHLASFSVKFREFIETFKEKLNLDNKTRGVPYFIAYIIGWLGEVLPFDTKYSRFSVKFLGSHSLLDQSKIKNQLGWKPKHGLEDTLEEIIDWYNKEKPDPRA